MRGGGVVVAVVGLRLESFYVLRLRSHKGHRRLPIRSHSASSPSLDSSGMSCLGDAV